MYIEINKLKKKFIPLFYVCVIKDLFILYDADYKSYGQVIKLERAVNKLCVCMFFFRDASP